MVILRGCGMSDPVDHPRHYTSHPSGIECIDVVEHMGFSLGNAIKYIWRADLKGDAVEDLKKARWYIDREIARLEAARATVGMADDPEPTLIVPEDSAESVSAHNRAMILRLWKEVSEAPFPRFAWPPNPFREAAGAEGPRPDTGSTVRRP